MQHNQDRKHRTYVYVLTVTETLEAWEDSVNIGTFTQHARLAVGVNLKRSFSPSL